MIKQVYCCLIILFVLVACGDRKNKDAAAEEETMTDSTPAASDSTLAVEESRVIINNIPWVTILESGDSSFNLDHFKLSESWLEEQLISSRFEPDSDFFELYKPFLKYSPDSSMFVDLDSYNIILKKQKNGRVIGYEAGPDNQVSLVILNDSIALRLMFNGPGTYVQEAIWLNDDTILMLGVTEFNEFNSPNPVAWKYNTQDKHFYRFDYDRKVNVDSIRSYSKLIRFKDIPVK